MSQQTVFPDGKGHNNDSETVHEPVKKLIETFSEMATALENLGTSLRNVTQEIENLAQRINPDTAK